MESILVNNLLKPECFAHEVSELRVIETHIAWLITTGEYVYKIKKPVNFGFLDFSTLEQRRYYCEEELRLNQRMSSDLYLEVVPISGSETEPRLADAGNPIEYAVKLKQFESGQLLSELLERDQFDPTWLEQLADKIADFHQRAPIVSPDSNWGEADSIGQLAEDNYQQINRSLLSADDLAELDRLADHSAKRFAQLEHLFRSRKLEGFVRECHGDLHLGNITLSDNQLIVFDCIEFNLEFRWIDRMADLAFLLMDLEARDHQRWANRCLNRYIEKSGDYDGFLLLPHYKSFRSMVRAKVAMLGEHPNQQEFRRYLNLTARYAEPAKPLLILMHGFSGVGKSTLAAELAQEINAIEVRSSVERRRIYTELSRRGEEIKLHGADMDMRTFHRMSEISEVLMQAGQTVILDATFIKQRLRRHFEKLAQRYDYPIRIVDCSAPDAVIRERLTERKIRDREDSDADVTTYERQQSVYDALSEDEQKISLKADTTAHDTIDRLVNELHAQSLVIKALN